jgi:hypothetical protein
MRVSEKRVLRRIYGPERDEILGEWRKLHNELHDLHSSPNIIRIIKLWRMRWEEYSALMREKGNGYRFLVGKRILGRPRCKWGIILRIQK